MTWTVNRDEAIVGSVDGRAVAGIWRGCWFPAIGREDDRSAVLVHGFLAAVWEPRYQRVGRFRSVTEAKDEIERRLT